MPEIDFGIKDRVQRADDEVVRVVNDAIATVGLSVAAGACGVLSSRLKEYTSARGGRHLPYEFAIAIGIVAGREYQRKIADAMVRAFDLKSCPIVELTPEQRLARLEERVTRRFGEAGAEIVDGNR